MLQLWFNSFARELKSLNDILVLPTIDYSWHYHDRNGLGNVSISHTNLYHTVILAATEYNMSKLNWILRTNTTTNNDYLIVVNKDNTSLSNVQITVSNRTGTENVTFLGNETSGSGEATVYNSSQTITATNGSFTDSFDSYAVHIYQIGGESSPDSPSSTTEYSICFSGCNATWSSFIIEGQ